MWKTLGTEEKEEQTISQELLAQGLKECAAEVRSRESGWLRMFCTNYTDLNHACTMSALPAISFIFFKIWLVPQHEGQQS